MRNSTAIKIGLAVWLAVAGVAVFTGCNTTQQMTAVKTLYSLEKVTTAAYDSYVGQVIAGRAPTNGVPAVSKAYNSFQSAALVELDLVQFSTNALASDGLTQLSVDLLNLITAVSK